MSDIILSTTMMEDDAIDINENMIILEALAKGFITPGQYNMILSESEEGKALKASLKAQKRAEKDAYRKDYSDALSSGSGFRDAKRYARNQRDKREADRIAADKKRREEYNMAVKKKVESKEGKSSGNYRDDMRAAKNAGLGLVERRIYAGINKKIRDDKVKDMQRRERKQQREQLAKRTGEEDKKREEKIAIKEAADSLMEAAVEMSFDCWHGLS